MSTRTRIVCTIGPASSDPDILTGMVRAGMSVARLNFSHGTHEEHALVAERVRAVEAGTGRAVAVLADLSGPKIRVGALPGGSMDLVRGDLVTITGEEFLPADGRIPVTHAEIHREVSEGDRILLDDGRIPLRVLGVKGTLVRARVMAGGRLEERKGVNVPGADLSLPPLTAKDLADLEFALGLGVDFVALSFVRSAGDLRLLRERLPGNGTSPRIIAKIETPRAVQEFRAILEETDAVMVARGDLGVEVGPARVPVLQKRLIARCREAGRPVITATEMLESMRENSRPTRAEASDVANAVFDGTDAVMLSAETSVGRRPVEVTKMMARILGHAERHLFRLPGEGVPGKAARHHPESAVAAAAVEASRAVRAKALVAFTRSGATARRISRLRPKAPIVALCPEPGVRRSLALSFGVFPLPVEPTSSLDQAIAASERRLLNTRRFRPGDPVVVVAGLPGAAGKTRVLALRRLGEAFGAVDPD